MALAKSVVTVVAALVAGSAWAQQTPMPEDLAWKVTYDPTTFVTDTIHEVQKTLIEAFILVVLVVYLFLGNLRATLIPTIAVPVSTGLTAATPGTCRLKAKLAGWRLTTLGVMRRSEPTTKRASFSFSV